jgi:hypothetical protein
MAWLGLLIPHDKTLTFGKAIAMHIQSQETWSPCLLNWGHGIGK